MTSIVPETRIRTAGSGGIASDGDYVLYWMTANRRGQANFSLQRAVEWCRELNKPLVILEGLQSDYPWASDRLHRFVIEGMAANANYFAQRSVLYYPYVEPAQGAARGLLRTLAQSACVVIGDDFPCFFLPRIVKAAAACIPVRFELVDSNGLLPMRCAEKVFARAFDFRRYLQRELLPHLADQPAEDPLADVSTAKVSLPKQIAERWPRIDPAAALADPGYLATLPIDHQVYPVHSTGGFEEAHRRLEAFATRSLSVYGEDRNQPDRHATSGLSPYLHFGHISAHTVFQKITREAGWTPDQVSPKVNGSQRGWWGADENAEGFLDQLTTWRELGYNMCWQREDYDQFDSLPAWAIQTLETHATDPREYTYDVEQLEQSATHDAIWNAAQREVVRDGHMHNYLRMLWGKKILEWSPSPRVALDVMIHLNNKYALDGRNPNSYSGIFWVLGRYDRAWGPERPIFGKIRYMSSDNTARKLKLKQYLAKYSAEQQQTFFENTTS